MAASPIKMTTRELVQLRTGLSALDASKGSKEGEINVLEYDVKTRYRLMKAAEIVGRECLAYDRLDKELQEKHGIYDGLPRNEANAKKIAAYESDLEKSMNDEVELGGILKIKLANLLERPRTVDMKSTDPVKLNALPQSAINRLYPIIEDEE
jgi:hypothetical protein